MGGGGGGGRSTIVGGCINCKHLIKGVITYSLPVARSTSLIS